MPTNLEHFAHSDRPCAGKMPGNENSNHRFRSKADERWKVISMNNNASLPNDLSKNDWQILGKLQLLVDAYDGTKVSAWLAETLSPLALEKRLITKVLISAQDGVARAMTSEPVLESKHLHLVVYAPQERGSNGQSWGFFRIEKLEGAETDEKKLDHTIEFYLYPEG